MCGIGHFRVALNLTEARLSARSVEQHTTECLSSRTTDPDKLIARMSQWIKKKEKNVKFGNVCFCVGYQPLTQFK